MTPNSRKVKKGIGEICNGLYEVIYQEAKRLNIYTYEVEPHSKAYKIFLAKEYDFEKEDILGRELLVYLINSNNDGDQSRFMRSIPPLDFDPGLESDYIFCIGSGINKIKIEVLDELKTLYDDIEDKEDREGLILEAIGSEYLEDYS